ncbi:MAG: hypothetical protein JOY63_13085 [Acetobacteraceae bacterium]|nr:hypothetical protein [Acetobacteraceae bacterium]
MEAIWHSMCDSVPDVRADWVPALIRGTAALAHRAFADHGLDDLLAFIDRPAPTPQDRAALTLDTALAHELRFQPSRAEALQREALAACRLFRVAGGFTPRSDHPLRLLALVARGNLMVNTPLDFITAHLDVQLDLLFVLPGEGLPSSVPEHDVAFFAVSESDPATLDRLRPLFRRWPRPALNNPAAVARLSRDTVASGLAGRPGLCNPPARRIPRDPVAGRQVLLDGPALIRPVGSHAGQSLRKLENPADLAGYLRCVAGDAFFLTQFVDYRGTDGLFRKYRLICIDRAPFLCHMAVSEHWMVHYLNAGMETSADRRAEEARAMAEFDTGFAVRHAAALEALNDWIGLDYFQLDCAEAPDGRLLVFEADVAAIVHLMDPPDLFPYKPAQMRRVFNAFDRMLRRRAGRA